MRGPESPNVEQARDEAEFDLPKYSIEGEENPFASKPEMPDFEALLKERDALFNSYNGNRKKLDWTKAEKIYRKLEKTIQQNAESLYDTPDEQKVYIENLSREILHKTLERIKRETTVQKELAGLADIGQLADIQKLLEDRNIKRRKLGRYEGAYFPLSGKIAVGKGFIIQSSRENLWSLCNNGFFPEEFYILIHEFAHAEYSGSPEQIKKMARIATDLFTNLYAMSAVAMGYIAASEGMDETLMYPILLSGLFAVLTRYRKPTVDKKDPLDEILARKTDRPFFMDSDSFIERFEHDIKDNYGFTSPKQIDQCLIASIETDQLLALGYSHKRIAHLARGAKWEGKNHTYDNLHTAVEVAKESRGLNDEELDSLVDARRIQRQINHLKIQKIALEELEAASQQISDEERVVSKKP